MKRGMSLVELVVAMSVMTLIIGIVVGLMLEVSQGWRRVSDEYVLLRPAQCVFNDLCNELESICFYDLNKNQLLKFNSQTHDDAFGFAKSTCSYDFFKRTNRSSLEYVKYSLRKSSKYEELKENADDYYTLYREGDDYALLDGITYFCIQPMMRTGTLSFGDARPDWFDVEMRICDPRFKHQHIFRRRVIVSTRI